MLFRVILNVVFLIFFYVLKFIDFEFLGDIKMEF